MKLFVVVILGAICSLVENIKVSQFTAKVYKAVAKNRADNFLICPVSLKLVLALIQVGAGGRTAKELSNVLDLPYNSENLRKKLRYMISRLEGTKQYELETANIIYVRSNFIIKREYKKVVTNYFKTGIENINFTNSIRAANIINQWVANKTKKKIKDIIEPNDLSEASSIILINAMYFHGKWMKKFNKKETKDHVFYRGPNDTIMVKMMKITSTFKYYKNKHLAATFLEMPYEGGDITMTFVLPDNNKGLSHLEIGIADIFQKFKYRSTIVNVLIPKFTIETSTDFTQILKDFGVKDVFCYNANFTGISSSPLSISSIIQKTFIEVNEQGTTAAAVTSVTKKRTIPLHLRFTANRPFIFFLKSKIGIFFIGRYVGH